MFSKPYPTHYCGIDRIKVRPNLIETHLFRFKDDNNHAYIIRAEKYPFNLYAIKFYLKAHRLSDKKYSLTTEFGKPIRILGTCTGIMKRIYEENPSASFVVIGANSIGEMESNTKRFKIYRRILNNLFPGLKFRSVENKKKSAYFLINNDQILIDRNLIIKITNLL